jgi:SAM-dependent methyltransferase
MKAVPQRETLRAWRRRFKKRMRRSRVRPSKLRMQAASLPVFWSSQPAVDDPNTLFSQRRRSQLRGHVQRLVSRDRESLLRLSEPRIAGVRDWEYAMLMGVLHARGERGRGRALDVGSGNSTFPHYLLRMEYVSEMTTLDLAQPLERAKGAHRPSESVRRLEGSMLDLPLESDQFDLVTCISAIEHLDGDRKAHSRDPAANPMLPYAEFVEQTRQALREMARVTAPGGLLYVTTDAFIPDLQRTDTWSSPDGSRPICSAYRFEDIESTFVDTVRSSGLELMGAPDYRVELLIEDPDRSTYRGRYFTTFAVAATKPG